MSSRKKIVSSPESTDDLERLQLHGMQRTVEHAYNNNGFLQGIAGWRGHGARGSTTFVFNWLR